MASTAYGMAASSICHAGIDSEKAAHFVLSCASQSGFAASPSSAPPFIETTFFGCWALKMAGKDIPDSAVSLVEDMQNLDGGFRRAQAGGISSPAYSFFALSVLTRFEKWRGPGD
jgi:hypothetical protein